MCYLKLTKVCKRPQNGSKRPENAQQRGGKKNFQFVIFGRQKVEKVGNLRKWFYTFPRIARGGSVLDLHGTRMRVVKGLC